eukprot:tig00000241_g20954.t1
MASSAPSAVPVAGKKRPRAASKPRAPKKVVGVSDGCWTALSDVKALKKDLKGQVKEVAGLVDADWHDGYEEQGEAVVCFFKKFKPIITAVLELSRASGVPAGAYERANEALFVLADAAEDMKAIPFRCDLSETYKQSEPVKIEWKQVEGSYSMTFCEPGPAIAWAWRVLLRSAAGAGDRVPDEQLLRHLRDASGYCAVSDLAMDENHSAEEGAKIPGGEAGHRRLAGLVESGRHEQLKSRARKYKMRRCIDRRFCGPKELRTRDFGSGSDSDSGCSDGGGGLSALDLFMASGARRKTAPRLIAHFGGCL